MRIALIDSWVDERKIHALSFSRYDCCSVTTPPCDINEDFRTHGTICAQVLDAYTSNYHLYSIRTMPDNGKNYKQTKGNIIDLQKALEKCLELSIDIICMSCVSSVLSDARFLYDITDTLSKNAVILAALDNRQYITVPTGFPFVFGVQVDWAMCGQPGDLFFEREDPLLAELYCNCNLGVTDNLILPISNSIAVPVAAARINTILNQSQEKPKDLHSFLLEQIPIYPQTQKLRCLSSLLLEEVNSNVQIPIVQILSFSTIDKTDRICLEIMNWLFENARVETACLTENDTELDIRFRSIYRARNIQEALSFMCRYYKTDLILISENKLIDCIGNEYLTILVNQESTKVMSSNESVFVPLSELPKYIFNLFWE